MKHTSGSRTRVRHDFMRLDPAQLKGLPKTAAGIERWIRRLGGRPVDAATKRRLKAAGHWGTPDE